MYPASAFLNYRRFLWNFLLTKKGQNNQSGIRGERRESGKQESKPQRVDFIILPEELHQGVCACVCMRVCVCDIETIDLEVCVGQKGGKHGDSALQEPAGGYRQLRQL